MKRQGVVDNGKVEDFSGVLGRGFFESPFNRLGTVAYTTTSSLRAADLTKSDQRMGAGQVSSIRPAMV